MSAKLNIIGRRFGRLFVFAEGPPTENQKPRRTSWVRCDCGTEKVVQNGALIGGGTKSCGCNQIKSKHGHAGQHRSTTYGAWAAMIQRCTNPHTRQFKDYGGRGITICERWLRFEDFLADMGERPTGKTLDRWPNKDGNYEKSNCRWATRKEQQRNMRTNNLLTAFGKTACISAWAEEYGMSKKTLWQRLQSGKLTHEEAVSRPVLRRAKLRDV